MKSDCAACYTVTTKPGESWVRLCPLHAAAEEMRALLEDYEREHFNDRGRECPCWQCERGRALLAKVGKGTVIS